MSLLECCNNQNQAYLEFFFHINPSARFVEFCAFLRDHHLDTDDNICLGFLSYLAIQGYEGDCDFGFTKA